MSKKLIVALSAVLLFVAAACQKAEEKIGGYEFNTPELKASAPEVNIFSIRDGEALKVSWAAAEEKGVVYHLNYSLEGAGEDGIKSLNCYGNKGVSYSYKELDALRAELGVAEGTGFKLTLQVKAKSAFEDLPKISEPLVVNIKYDINPLELYGIGTAFKWGDNKAEAEKMTTEDHVVFTWEGWLEAGKDKTFKFLTNEAMDTESDIPCYVKDPDDRWGDGDMLFIVSSSQKEALFTVEKSGIYRLTVDTGRLNIKTKYLGDGKPHFYGCGDVFKWGWEYSAAEEFTTTDQKIWTWTGDLNKEEFIILSSNRDYYDGYVWDKSADGNYPTGEETVWSMKKSDRAAYGPSFVISQNGNYTLTINYETMKLTIKCNQVFKEKLHFYGFGDAFSWGWNTTKMEEFTTSDDKTWTWTGDLKQEDFVILASRTDEGGYVWDKSADGNAAPVGPETVWTMKAMNDVFDRNAYSFTISKAGNYTLTINGETLKLTIKCNDPWE